MEGFFNKVYEIVKSIPYGKVANYGTVAILMGHPRAAKQVGWALHANPDPEHIPCHRVVKKDGSLSAAFAFGGIAEHRARLAAEGVEFDDDKVKREFFISGEIDIK